jgi:hypothetical protein
MRPARPPLLPLSRRGFLRLGAASAAFVGLAQLRAVPAAARSATTAEAGAGFFAPRETEILTQVVERLVDTGEPDAPAVRETRTVQTIDSLCRGLDPALTGLLPAALRLFEWGPVLFDRRLARFTSLDDDGKDDSLRGWRSSRLAVRRQAFYAIRNLAFLGYYSQEEVWPLVGYAGPLLAATEQRT